MKRKNKIKTHGQSFPRTKEYSTWSNIKQRCHNVNCPDYKDYGGRGIRVCAKWRKSFDNFLKDMGRAPKNKTSIDRINTNKGYFPSNCRWANSKEQQWNKRDNVNIIIGGKIKPLMVWARLHGITPQGVRYRIKSGMSPVDAIKIKPNRLIRICNKKKRSSA